MNTHTVEELYRLAQQGNTEALTRLGICYKNGTGTAVDHSAAAQCFYSAANAGNAEAQYQLGICYEEGIGLEQDMSAAGDRKSTRLNSSHANESRMPSSA